MNSKVYIYALREKGNVEFRYIGKTSLPQQRLLLHLDSASVNSTHPKEWWLADVISRQCEVEMKIIEETDDLNWFDREQFWIKHYGEMGHRLTNIAVCGRLPYINSDALSVRIEIDDLVEKCIDALLSDEQCIIGKTDPQRHVKAIMHMIGFWRSMHPSDGDPFIWIERCINETARYVNRLDACNRERIGECFRDVFWHGCGRHGCRQTDE